MILIAAIILIELVIKTMIAYVEFIAGGGGHRSQHRWSCNAVRFEFGKRQRDPSQRSQNSSGARRRLPQSEGGRPDGQRNNDAKEGCDGGTVRPPRSVPAIALQAPRAPHRQGLSQHVGACPNNLVAGAASVLLRRRVRR